MLQHLSDLKKRLPAQVKKLALAGAHDLHALEAVFKAKQAGIIEPILVGNRFEIDKSATELGICLDGIAVYEADTIHDSVHKAVALVSRGEADILMKGRMQTAELLVGVLNKEWGLKMGNKLSHMALFESAKYHKLFGITDVAMNSAPNLDDKRQILENAVRFMHRIGVTHPAVAVLAAIEKVNPKMLATVEADALMQMNLSGIINGCDVFGPIAFDGAMSRSIAEDKQIFHRVAGDADILLVPNIETGNVLYKSLILFSDVKVASIIVGAKAPIVLTSRSDSEETKFNSILLATVTC